MWYGLLSPVYELSREIIDYRSAVTRCLGEIASDQMAFIQAIGLLRKFSLVETTEGSETYSLHPVLHRWAFFCKGRHPRELSEVGTLLIGTWTFYDVGSRHEMFRKLFPHAQACYKWILERFGPPRDLYIQENPRNLTFLSALHRLAGLFDDHYGKYDQAENLFAIAGAFCEQMFGPRSHKTLSKMVLRSDCMLRQGRLGEAAQLLLRVLQDVEQNPESERVVVQAQHSLAVIYLKLGRLIEAEPLLNDALRGYQKLFGPKDSNTLDVMRFLAELNRHRGNLNTAETRYKEALQQGLDIQDPLRTLVYGNLAGLMMTYLQQKRHKDLQEILERTLNREQDDINVHNYVFNGQLPHFQICLGILLLQRDPARGKALLKSVLDTLRAAHGTLTEHYQQIERRLKDFEINGRVGVPEGYMVSDDTVVVRVRWADN